MDIRPQDRRKADSAVVPVLGPVPVGLFEFGHICSVQSIAILILISISTSLLITIVVVMLYLVFLASVTRLLMLLLLRLMV